jgi:hypothetical protein
MRYILNQLVGAVIALDPDDIYIDMESAEEFGTKLDLALTALGEGNQAEAIELIEEVYDFWVRRLIRFHRERREQEQDLGPVHNMTEAAFSA